MAKMAVSRRTLMAGAAGLVLPGGLAEAGADGPDTASAGFPAPITAIPFGSSSHWLQPWRGLCRTRSAAEIAAGIGATVGGFATPQPALDMLYRHGFRLVRTELPWTMVDPQTETHLVNAAEVKAFLARLKMAGLRPLILLNANDGWPCPVTPVQVRLAADAPAGARSITLVSTNGLVPGRSGPQRIGNGKMAPVLVTGISGQEVHLSKPLPVPLAAGTGLPFVTLHYAPFSQPGSPGNRETMQGWLRYVDIVCETALSALGTEGQADCGFDLEIWNELTFGSDFLQINKYYNPPLLHYDPETIFHDIVTRTAEHLRAAAAKYPGMRITDGFANTAPFIASSQEPPGVGAISKHPYPPALAFPNNPGEPHIVALDAFGKKTEFVPTYKCFFPEYFANVIQTETLCRDVSDQTNMIYGVAHGRLARIINGRPDPVAVWITEIGCAPPQFHITEPAEASRLMTAFTLRCVLFYLNIGVERVYMFQAFAKPGDLGLVDPQTVTTPSAPLLALARALAAIGGGAEAGMAAARADLKITAFRNPSGEVLFSGNGTPNLPDMTAADSLVLLPIQASATRFAIVYYVMTRDIRVPLEPQNLAIEIAAPGIGGFAATCYDPVSDGSSAPAAKSGAGDTLRLEIAATDTPQILLLTA